MFPGHDTRLVRRRTGVLALILSSLLIATPLAIASAAPPTSPSSPPGQTRTRGPHVMPMRPTPGQLKSQSTTPPTLPSTAPAPHLSYYGGRVISNVQVVQVLWGSGSYIPEIQGTGTPSIGSFYRSVLANSFPFTGWLNGEYNTVDHISGVSGQPHTDQHIGAGTFAGQVQITPAATPAPSLTSGCPVSESCIDDSQIQSELSAQIQAHHLPQPTLDSAGNANVYYAVFFPSGTRITQGGSASCQNNGFLAYHGTVAATSGANALPEFYYGVHPDESLNGQCGNNVGTGSAFNNQTIVASHELVEAMTDPEVGIATNPGPPLGWYDNQVDGSNGQTNGEIGDLCYAYGRRTMPDPATGSAGTYYLQYEWSNAHNACYLDDAPGTFLPVLPARILDTRNGTGAVQAPVPANTEISLQIGGHGGVPASGANAVVLNVTATNAHAPGYVTVHPSDTSPPTASNLNFEPGQTVPNQVTVKLGPTGSVSLLNGSPANLDLVADVAGYYVAGATTQPGTFVPLTPARLLDSRATASLQPGESRTLTVAGQGGIAPGTGAGAVALNVTATDTTAAGFVTVYPAGDSRPTASNLNFSPGQTTPNAVTVKEGTGGQIVLYNGSPGPLDLVVDSSGYYNAGVPTLSGAFVPLTPSRILDSRIGTGAGGPIAAQSAVDLLVAGMGGVGSAGPARAVVMNTTVTDPGAAGYITVFPFGIARPVASNLNFVTGQTIPNLVTVPLRGGKVSLFNGSPGTVQLIGDVAGYFLA